MANRRWTRFGYGLLAAVVLASAGWLALRRLLPPMVEHRAIRMMEDQGLKASQLTVRSLGLHEAAISDLRFTGEWGGVKLDAVRARYSLSQLLQRRLSSLELDGVQLDFNVPASSPKRATAEPVNPSINGVLNTWPTRLPFDNVRVLSGSLRLHRYGAQRTLPFTATLAAETSDTVFGVEVGQMELGSLLRLESRWGATSPASMAAGFDVNRPAEWIRFALNDSSAQRLADLEVGPWAGTLELTVEEGHDEAKVAGRLNPFRAVLSGAQADVRATSVSGRVRRQGWMEWEVRSALDLTLEPELQAGIPELAVRWGSAGRLTVQAGDFRLSGPGSATLNGDLALSINDPTAGSAASGELEFSVRSARLPGLELQPFTGSARGDKDRLDFAIPELTLEGPGRWRVADLTGELLHAFALEAGLTAEGFLGGSWGSNLVAGEALPFEIRAQRGPQGTRSVFTFALTNVEVPRLAATPSDRLSGLVTGVSDSHTNRSDVSIRSRLALSQATLQGWIFEDVGLVGEASLSLGRPLRPPMPGFLLRWVRLLPELSLDRLVDYGFDLQWHAAQVRRHDGLTLRAPTLRVSLPPRLRWDDQRRAVFAFNADSIAGWGVQLTDLQLAGQLENEILRISGKTSLAGSAVPFTLEMRVGSDASDVSDLSGHWTAGPLHLEHFAVPRQWTGGADLSVTGDITIESPIRVVGGNRLEASPVLALSLTEVEWPDRTLTLADLEATVTLVSLNPPVSGPDQLVTVGRITFDFYEVTDVRCGLAWQPDGNLRLQLLGARLFDGHINTDPFLWCPQTGDLDLVVHIEDLDLARLTQEIPRWKGSLQGRVDGRIPLTRKAGSWRTLGGRLELDHRTGARLEYPAAGLLTDSMSPESPRYAQLRLVEDGLKNLDLEVLTLDLLDSRTSSTAVRVRIEGTSSSPRAIVPVRMTLNLNGQFEELLRLLEANRFEVAF